VLIRQAAVVSMYSYIIQEPEKYDVVEIYYAYMVDADGRSRKTNFEGQKYECRRQAINWIIKHSSDLLKLLVEDIYANFCW
jgi:elongation factor P hydroxylase